MSNRTPTAARSQTRAGVVPVRDASGRIVAGVRPDGTLQKEISGSRHFLRYPPAIAFDLYVLDSAEVLAAGRPHAGDVEVLNTDDGRMYYSTIAEIRGKGFKVSRGHGAQIGLALGQWRTSNEPCAEQLALFA